MMCLEAVCVLLCSNLGLFADHSDGCNYGAVFCVLWLSTLIKSTEIGCCLKGELVTAKHENNPKYQ